MQSAAPGDLLLLEGKSGECGGILRLKNQSAFFVLNAAQIWRGHTVPWPLKGDNMHAFRIHGNKLEFVLK